MTRRRVNRGDVIDHASGFSSGNKGIGGAGTAALGDASPHPLPAAMTRW